MDLQVWPLPSTYLNKCFKWHYFSSRRTTAKLFWNPCIKVGVMARQAQFMWHSSVTLTFNLPEKMSRKALLPLKDNNCAKLFWNPCMNVEVMVQTNLDGRMHTRTYTEQKLSQLCLALLQAGLTKMVLVRSHHIIKCRKIENYSNIIPVAPSYLEHCRQYLWKPYFNLTISDWPRVNDRKGIFISFLSKFFVSIWITFLSLFTADVPSTPCFRNSVWTRKSESSSSSSNVQVTEGLSLVSSQPTMKDKIYIRSSACQPFCVSWLHVSA